MKRKRWGVFQALGPLGLEVIPLGCARPPQTPCLDACFEIGKALEGNAHGILDARGVEAADDLITEKGAVHAHLDRDPGQGRPHDSDTAEDEVLGPMGVMDVAGTMQHIEHLTRLGDRAEERIIAAAPSSCG
jgi:hypothetical protein